VFRTSPENFVDVGKRKSDRDGHNFLLRTGGFPHV
jgi:hypothetical protein